MCLSQKLGDPLRLGWKLGFHFLFKCGPVWWDKCKGASCGPSVIVADYTGSFACKAFSPGAGGWTLISHFGGLSNLGSNWIARLEENMLCVHVLHDRLQIPNWIILQHEFEYSLVLGTDHFRRCSPMGYRDLSTSRGPCALNPHVPVSSQSPRLLEVLSFLGLNTLCVFIKLPWFYTDLEGWCISAWNTTCSELPAWFQLLYTTLPLRKVSNNRHCEPIFQRRKQSPGVGRRLYTRVIFII